MAPLLLTTGVASRLIGLPCSALTRGPAVLVEVGVGIFTGASVGVAAGVASVGVGGERPKRPKIAAR